MEERHGYHSGVGAAVSSCLVACASPPEKSRDILAMSYRRQAPDSGGQCSEDPDPCAGGDEEARSKRGL